MKDPLLSALRSLRTAEALLAFGGEGHQYLRVAGRISKHLYNVTNVA